MGLGITLAIFGLGQGAGAVTYNYDDIYANWPGWFINAQDEIGQPQITDIDGIIVTIEGGYLREVVIDMDPEFRIPWDNSATDPYYDSLFINSNWNGSFDDYQSWDYYVRDDTQNNDSDGTLYQVSSSYRYIFAPTLAGANLRSGHPAGIETGLTPITGISGFFVVWDEGEYKIIYTFPSNLISVGDRFVIGYSVWCANDVALTPVPEPGAILLLGMGLLTLGIAARKIRR